MVYQVLFYFYHKVSHSCRDGGMDLTEEALEALTTDLVRLSVIVTDMLWSIIFFVGNCEINYFILNVF